MSEPVTPPRDVLVVRLDGPPVTMLLTAVDRAAGMVTVEGAHGAWQVPARRRAGTCSTADSTRMRIPTPMAADGGKGRGSSAGWGLRNFVKQHRFPTPSASSYGSNQSPSAGAAWSIRRRLGVW